MKSLAFYQHGLSLVSQLEGYMSEWQPEEVITMVAGGLLKFVDADSVLADDFSREEIRADCERAAKICIALAHNPACVGVSASAMVGEVRVGPGRFPIPAEKAD